MLGTDQHYLRNEQYKDATNLGARVNYGGFVRRFLGGY